MPSFNSKFSGGGGALVVTDLEVDSPTLVIDETNNRVGMGTIAPGTQLQVESNTPYVTLKNDTSENSDGGCESKLIFEDHANASLGQIEVSHSGASDDTKGKMILSTHTGSSLTAAITINEAQKVTAAGDVQVTGDIILDDGGSLKEAGGTAAITFDGSGNVTKIGQDSLSSGDVLTYDGAKWVGEAPTTGDITGVTAGTLLDGGGNSGDVTLNVDLTEAGAATIAAGDHVLFLDGGATGTHAKGSINDVATLFAGTAASTGLSASSGVLSVSDLHPVGVSGSANQLITDDGDGTVTSESGLSYDGSTLAVTGDVSVSGGDITYGATNSTLSLTATAHDAAGATLNISGGATTAGTSNNQAGGSVTISGGQGKGSGAGGDIIFKTANAGGSGSSLNALATALTISDDKSATFEDNVTVKGDIIIDDGGSLKEAGGTAALTYNASAEITTLKVAADSVAVADDHMMFFNGGATGTPKAESIADLVTAVAGTASSTGLSASSGVLSVSDLHPVGVDGANNQILTDDGDGTVTSESKLTFDGTTLLVNSDVTATTNHTTVGAQIDYDATGIIASGQTGNNVGLDVDINSDSPTMVGTVNNIGLDIDLTGGTSGTQVNVGVDVNVSGADTNIAALFNGGNVGIGTAAPAQILQVSDATPIVVVQNTTNEHTDGGAESKVLFADHAGNALGQIEGAHSGSSDDAKGQFLISTNNGSGTQLAMSIDDTQLTTFSGDVVIAGTNPKLTIGDAGAEDTMLVFDGNAQDYRIGLDDGTDVLEIGVGSAHGTTPALTVDASQNIDVFKAINLDSALADNSVCGITSVFTAGEALNRGDVVYFKASDSKMHKVNMTAGSSEAIPAVAMAADDISADAAGKFLLQGFIHDAGTFPSYTIAGRLFAPESEGPPTQTAPSTDGDLVQVLGWAVTADKIYFNPSPDFIEVA